MALNVGEIEATLRLKDEMSAQLNDAMVTTRSFGRVISDLGPALRTAETGERSFNSALLQFSGMDVIEKAHAYERAVEAIGGATKLTEAEQKEVNAVLSEAIQKYQLIDQYAPATMKDLAAQTKQVETESRALGSQLKDLGQGLTHIGVLWSGAVTAPIVGAGAAAVHFGMDFESAMARTRALAGASGDEIANLKGQVLALAPTVGIGPGALAEGLFPIESEGYRGAKAMEILKTAAQGSAIGMGDMFTVSRTLVTTMKAFQQQGLSSAEAMNTLVATIREGDIPIDSLVGSLGRVTPIASALGIPFHEVGAAIATFTRVGVSADIATTGLRAVLTGLEMPTSKAGAAISALYGSVQNLRDAIAKNGLSATLVDLIERTHGNADALHELFPNVRALAAALSNAKSQGDDYLGVADRIKHANDVLTGGFATTADTLAFQWNQIKAAAEVLAVKLGEVLIPRLKDLVPMVERLIDRAGAWLDWFSKLPGPVQDTGLALAGVTAAMGPLLLAVGQLSLGLGGLARLFEEGGIAATTWSAASTTASGVLTTLEGGAISAAGALSPLGEAVAGVVTGLGGLSAPLVAGIAAVGAVLVAVTAGVWDMVGGWKGLADIGGDVMGILTSVASIAEDVLLLALRAVSGEVASLKGAFTDFAGWCSSTWKFVVANIVPQELKDDFVILRTLLSNAKVVAEGAAASLHLTATETERLAATSEKAKNDLKGLVGEGFKPAVDATTLLNASNEDLARGTVLVGQNLVSLGTTTSDYTKKTHDQIAAEKAHAKAVADVAASLVPLNAEQILGVETLLKMGNTIADVAKVMDVQVSQIRRWQQETEAAKKATEAFNKVVAAMGKEGTKLQEDWEKSAVKSATIVMDTQQMAYLQQLTLTKHLNTQMLDESNKRTMDEFEYRRSQVDQWVEDEKKKVDTHVKGWSDAYAAIDVIAQGRIEDIQRAHDDAIAKMKSTENSWVNVFKTALDGIPKILQQAFTGGGGMGGAVNAIMSQIGSGLAGKGLTDLFNKGAGKLSEVFGMGFTSTLGTLIPGIGQAIGGLLGPLVGKIGGFFKGLFGSAGRDAVEDFAKSMGGFDQLHAKLGELGAEGETLWKKLTQGVGRNNPEQAKAVIADINAAFDKQKASIEALNTTAGGYFQQLLDMGGKLPASMQPYLDSLIKSGKITGDNATLIAQLLGENQSDFGKMEEVANKYGIALSSLGPAFQANKLHESAQEIWDDFNLLVDGGADTNAVLTGMADKISGLVQTSLAFGIAIPENFKPLVEKLVESGQLLDANGQKITDLSGINFGGDALTTSIENLITKIGELIDKLAGPGGVSATLEDIGRSTVRPHIAPIIDLPGDTGGDGGDEGGIVHDRASTGAVVGRSRVLQFPSRRFAMGGAAGTDVVPAWLTPGEVVLNAAQQANVADHIAVASSQTRGTGTDGRRVTIHTHVHLNAREIADAINDVQIDDVSSAQNLLRY